MRRLAILHVANNELDSAHQDIMMSKRLSKQSYALLMKHVKDVQSYKSQPAFLAFSVKHEVQGLHKSCKAPT